MILTIFRASVNPNRYTVDVHKLYPSMPHEPMIRIVSTAIRDYWKRAESSKIPSIIEIPTTAGTGSETGLASANINKDTAIKKIIFH